ncbi:MAG: LptF/LptG family permease [Synergistaceae bacterium]|jgi:lipopolysaccharide export system permease protein|nr:LptF/LptG family permease [Synergistaceae bacterium]
MPSGGGRTGGFILDRFVLGQMSAPFMFGILSFTVILVAGNLLFKLADLVIQRGVSFGIVTRLFIYSLPGVVTLTIPMSCLLAALLGFGNMSANSELVALKSAGISFGRIVRPLIISGIFISIIAFLMNETIVPLSERAVANVMRYEVLRSVPPIFKENVFIREESEGVLRRVFYIGAVKPRSGEMSDVLVQEFEDGHIRRLISAPKGDWTDGVWWLENGQVFEVQTDGVVKALFSFERQKLNLAVAPSKIGNAASDPSVMGLMELYDTIRNAELHGNDTGKLWMLLNLRISVPWASVVLVMVGAAVGSRPQRSSSGMGLGLSVVIVFIYYVIMSFCKSLGEARFLPGAVAAWIPNVAFFMIGMVMTRRANRLG